MGFVSNGHQTSPSNSTPIKCSDSLTSLSEELTREFDGKIASLEKRLNEKDEIIEKQHEIIEEQREKLHLLEEDEERFSYEDDFEDNQVD